MNYGRIFYSSYIQQHKLANPCWAAVFHPEAALWPGVPQSSLFSWLTENVLYSTEPNRLPSWSILNISILCAHIWPPSVNWKLFVGLSAILPVVWLCWIGRLSVLSVFFSPLSQYLPDSRALKITLLSVFTKHQHNAAPTVQRPIPYLKQYSTRSNYNKLLQ